jgi:DNA-binding transcriptional ArsR family regulator
MDDPLEQLLLDADEVDRAELAQSMHALLGVDTKTGRVVLKPGFNQLDTRRRVLAYLLGAKVAVLLGKSESEAVSPSDLTSETGMPKGTVNPKLSELYKDRLVSKTKNGAYYVAPHQVQSAIAELQD